MVFILENVKILFLILKDYSFLTTNFSYVQINKFLDGLNTIYKLNSEYYVL